MRKAITIKEIALKLGMDYSTVSRILNQDFKHHKYRPETIEKVKNLADKYGLSKNRAAATLKSGKAKLIGVSMSNIGFPFFGQLSATIDRELNRVNYRTIIANNDNSLEAEETNIRDLLSYQVDGIVICPFQYSKMITGTRVPMVVVDNDIYPEKPFVGLDGYKAGRELALTAVSKGYKKIGLLYSRISETRADGVLSVDDSKKEIAVLRPPENLRREDLVEKQTEYLLQRKCELIISLNGILTTYLLDFLSEKKLEIPKDIGIAGIDELPCAKHFSPALTTVEQPIDMYGKKVVKLLMKQIEKNKTDLKRYLFPGQLHKRKSM